MKLTLKQLIVEQRKSESTLKNVSEEIITKTLRCVKTINSEFPNLSEEFQNKLFSDILNELIRVATTRNQEDKFFRNVIDGMLCDFSNMF